MFELFIWLIVIFIIRLLLDKKLRVKYKTKIIYKTNNIYSIKPLMSKYERYFYNILIELEDELNVRIMPQVNLASIINKESNNKYRNELFRNIDFGIFTKDYDELLLLIEINDKTHNYNDRKYRDKKVNAIVENVGIRLIKFYSNYPNKKDYVKQRVKDELKNKIEMRNI